ncbi:hypothetical protein U472_10350 [Orenia metallireducens]|uniref:Uncharacterized protein n=1 Tax=Orenia metallireducens TaxID=1413210 RepID=A0A1C0A853_9FIRM|nr:hypothetical protein [Orenia metallireducens]OCL26394.1 hypothetical protein U472_10350 [Orenia metallireducens]
MKKLRIASLFLIILLSYYLLLAPIKVICKEEQSKLSLFEEAISTANKGNTNIENDEEDDNNRFWDLFCGIFDFIDFSISIFDEDEYKNSYYNNKTVSNLNQKNFNDTSLKMSLATHLVSEDITGLRLNSKLGLDRFGLEFNFSDYIEELKERDNHLYFSEGLLTVDFSSTQNWELIGGAGFHNISGDEDNLGLKFAYKVSYSKAPITLYLDLGTSFFKNSNLLEFTPGISYGKGDFECRGGYRVLKVSNQNLKGPEFEIIYHFD